MKVRLLFCLIPVSVTALLFLSCGLNIFSPFNPTNTNNVSDVNTLIAMGDYYLHNLDYSDAYNAYSKAMAISPKNSKAIEGACTSYIYMKIPITNLILSLLNNNVSTPGLLNTLYNVSGYVSSNLYPIINNQADGVIPANDNTVNLNFYFFNELFSIFFTIDTDNSGNVEDNTNDLIIVNNNFTPSMSPRLSNAIFLGTNVNNLVNPIAVVKTVPTINIINVKVNFLTNNLKRSAQAVTNIVNTLVTTQAKQEFSQITSSVAGAVNQLLNIVDMLDTNYNETLTYTISTNILGVTYSSNVYTPVTITPLTLTNFYSITNQVPIRVYTNYTYFFITNDAAVDSKFLSAGYSNTISDYVNFTNDSYNSSLTDPTQVTNLMTRITDMSSIITNYFNLL